MDVKVISSEIPMILEADVLRVTEGSNHSTEIKHLRSWNIAESCERQGDVSPTGSKTAAWYQMETIGTRETQNALSKGVCDIKPINGKILQTAFRESDQFVVLLKQGNSCGGKGLTVESLKQGCILRTLMRIKDVNKTGLKTYLEKDGEVLLKSRMREIFTSGSVRGLIV